jgi:uncharacterized protein (TIGR02266 family)
MSDYWIRDVEGRVLGPIGLEVLHHLVKAGRLNGLTRASRDGRHFDVLQSFPEVASVIAEALHADRAEWEQQEARRLREQLQVLRGKPAHEVFGLPERASLDAFRGAFFAMVRRFYPARLPSEAQETLRQAHGEMSVFLSQLMAQLEQRAAAPAPPALPPAVRAEASTPGRPGVRPTPTYELYEFVGWERREDNHVHVDLRITLASLGLFTEYPATNIAQGGVYLATRRMIPLGERLQLAIHFDDPARDVSARGVVVWQNEQPTPRHLRGVGVRFTLLAEEDRRFIGYYLKKAQLRASAP